MLLVRLTVFAALLLLAAPAARAQSLAEGAQAYKPFVVARASAAVAAAKALEDAAKAGDVKAAQAAWIRSREGWEAIEPITSEFFAKFDAAIDAWPDATQGYHAIEAPLFAGKRDGLGLKAEKLAADLASFAKAVGAPRFRFAPQGLLNGAAKLAYEVGENKSKGGESPFAATSHRDLQANAEGLETLYVRVFDPVLGKRDAELASLIREKLAQLKRLVAVDDLKSLDQPALHRTGEELAVLLQTAAPKLKLKKPAIGEAR
ncbi:MAG TPA: EfeM/EfeO family lipoprotein [Xanthobacteraceae bacterium]|nr:EfeM/EfeO family lipoprotein [Xanthobacteraceae bacterium]